MSEQAPRISPKAFHLLKESSLEQESIKSRKTHHRVRGSFHRTRKYIIIGAGWAGRTIAHQILKRKTGTIIGFVDDRLVNQMITITGLKEPHLLPVLAHSSELLKNAEKYHATDVVLAVTHDREEHLLGEIVRCHEADISFHQMPELYAQITKKIPVYHSNHHWIYPRLTAPKHDLYVFLNDLVNYSVSFVGFFLFLVPLYPLVAIAIKLGSKGPVLFRQKRVGYRGREFIVFKFRTMQHNAENGQAMWAEDNDSRITRVGRFLRKFRLDEIPQFFNVLKGDMALIGPRPERPEFINRLVEVIPFYNYRHLVRPGISGWAQVNYRYGNSTSDALEKLQYDLYWIKNRSFWLDLKIILKSIKVMLTGFGAL